MESEIQLCTGGEASAAAGLLRQQLDEHHIASDPADIERMIRGVIDHPERGFVLVQRAAGQLVGVAYLAYTWTLEHAGKVVWLEELYVTPGMRGNGLGQQLLRAAMAHAAAQGCVAVDLEVEHDHARAERLYQREGFLPHSRRRWFRRLVPLLLVAAPWVAQAQVIPCERAGERIQAEGEVLLDPSCVWTAGVDITTSGTTLDCQGALILDVEGDSSRGILISSDKDVPLSDVTVRNCVVQGFLNNVRATRAGFKELEEGQEYDAAWSNVVIESSTLIDSRGSGLFVDGYVTDVTVRGLDISGAGSVGIYLEAGSRDNVVEGCHIHGNGYGDVQPSGEPWQVGPVTVYYLGTGREGIAIDGSRDNVVRGNVIEGNAAGGVFLYKNCGEYSTQKPQSWWPRPYGATGNLIEGNVIRQEDTGVWVGSRMAQNQFWMDCSDPAYIAAPFAAVVLDQASGAVVRDNTFEDVGFGIRVEDDDTYVEANTFSSADRGRVAMVVGTRFRTEQLGWPVTGTVLRDNLSTLPGSPRPYLWIHDHEATYEDGNLALGRPAPLRRGKQPKMEPFLFVEDFWVAASPGSPDRGE